MKKIIFTLCLLGFATSLEAATVNWVANADNGLSLANGTSLANGNWVRLGYFDFTGSLTQIDAAILSRTNNITGADGLISHWVSYADGQIGAGSGTAASHFDLSNSANTNTLGLENKQIFLWALASTDNSSISASLANATQQGVFYLDNTFGTNWKFPPEGLNSTNVELTDLTDAPGTTLASGAHIAIGGFGTGTSPEYPGAPNFNLANVPEPSTLALSALAALAVAGVRRRRRG